MSDGDDGSGRRTERYDPPDLWKPFGAFSMCAVQGDGRIVHLKGQVALDREGRVVGPGDMRLQTRQVHENIRTALRALGGSMADILSLTQHVTDIEAFMTTGDIRSEFFAPPYPATTTVQVVRLFRPDLVVEITALAEIPRDRFRRPAG